MDYNGRLNGLLKKANVLCSRSNGMFSRSNGYRTVCKRDFFEPFAKALSYVFPERVTSNLINKSVNQNSYPHLVIILTALFWSLCSLLPGVILVSSDRNRVASRFCPRALVFLDQQRFATVLITINYRVLAPCYFYDCWSLLQEAKTTVQDQHSLARRIGKTSHLSS